MMGMKFLVPVACHFLNVMDDVITILEIGHANRAQASRDLNRTTWGSSDKRSHEM